MVNRLMDLLVLVAEWVGRSDTCSRELGEELSRKGYSADEIQQALSWVSSRWHRPGEAWTEFGGAPSIRVLSPWEAAALDADAHGYILRLRNLGVVDAVLFEQVMQRVPSFRAGRLGLGELKALAGAVVFNLGSEQIDEEALHLLDDIIRIT